jgi:hypothetical protein
MYVMRIGDLCRDNPVTFNARAQAKRFFETAWKPKRLKATVQAKEFLSKTSLDLTIIMAKQQKELNEKERKEREDFERSTERLKRPTISHTSSLRYRQCCFGKSLA